MEKQAGERCGRPRPRSPLRARLGMKKEGGRGEGVLVHDVMPRTVYQEGTVVRTLKRLCSRTEPKPGACGLAPG